ncbi:MAG: glycosyl transferase family 36 [Ignavibacteria bacterium]|jgi:cellobiose phosphorylase|nr:glycosyl transferase family 36 [Ignavibacteria bacterium]MCU7504701.1 glycosyl transferase family 36 [Ignavibacteria bacterium]MCU7516303.1 glycosyl transferase family 36 [Ignavibacteria bacterium]
MFENKYGHFSEDFREYIITEPRTPRPWFNYIWNEHYAGLISHTGGGFSFLDSPRDNRISRMRYNCLPWDRPGRYIIVKDVELNKYWSLSWAPTIDLKYDKYECRHGQGYTKIITEIFGIRGELTYFVPMDINAEIWNVKLTDLTGKDRHLEVYSFVELMMGNALNDIINEPNDKHFTEIKFNKEHEAILATRRYWVLNKKVSVAQPNIDWKYNLVFAGTLPAEGFDGSLDSFIGRWRSEANPESIETGIMKNNEITAGDPVAALKSKLMLGAGASSEFAVILGIAPKEEDPFEHLRLSELKSTGVISEKFGQMKKHWDRHLGHIKVNTPDKKFDAMLGVWTQYQAAVTFDMARNAGYYHGGLLFGTGMRDQFQDIIGMVIADPGRVRKRLLNALRFQFSNGSTLHNFFKLTNSGERTNHSDTPLWIPFGLVEYLNETGDFEILEEKVDYYDEGCDTVYMHMVKALDFAISATTERSLPKIMNGDWNDTLDHIGPLGKGETVWGAFFLAYVLRKTFELLELRRDTVTLGRFTDAYNRLKAATNEFCWDGEWYIRAFKDNGEPVGTHKDKQGKIFINSQTWPVISGLATKERADKALQSCKKHLLKPYGIQICWPSFTEIADDIGLISRCVPGKKENGAIFNHASSWFVLASILNGDVETAYDVYSKMLPLNSARNIDSYEVEPYVFAEYVTSPDHPTENQASHSWLTGTAVWMLRIGLDYILGFRTSLRGVEIKPNIPSSWKGFKAERVFRGKRLLLEVNNEAKVNSSVKSIKINGKVSEDAFIDPNNYETDEIKIEIVMG